MGRGRGHAAGTSGHAAQGRLSRVRKTASVRRRHGASGKARARAPVATRQQPGLDSRRPLPAMTALVDNNVLVYRFDPRDSAKQHVARELLREGIERDTLRVPHQAIVEFVQAVTRPLGRGKASLLARPDALREAEELLAQFEVLYPTD